MKEVKPLDLTLHIGGITASFGIIEEGKFTGCIEDRPAIWNMHSKLYANKTAKRNAWEEMVLIFCKSDNTEEKRKYFYLRLSLQKNGNSYEINM
ncbi:unnamed protein product [Acanthoscelides obtectus]|uniref:MADF domain-containing protein n=1 Tax=Acanthoscelides obtectus TaxID=200917 RepID=A0A9P0LMA8_ACAOB|nr:unnamed protein product [Acanthoscelides obtectus]CAK1650158.1 hypothetical protein AOBTE_LOCUS16648 [Acanthoscelides obtectus]